MHGRWQLWVTLIVATGGCVAACRSKGQTDSVDAASSASASESAPASSASASALPPPLAPMQLLRFTVASSVRGKEPVDVLEAAEPGQRVWAHFNIRNRSGQTRRLSVVFTVNGQKRTTLDLKVEPSWSFRTWGYNTLRKADTSGEIQIEATDDQGLVVASAKIPIQKKSVKKKAPAP